MVHPINKSLSGVRQKLVNLWSVQSRVLAEGSSEAVDPGRAKGTQKKPTSLKSKQVKQVKLPRNKDQDKD